MQLRNLAANSPRRSRLLSSNKTPKTIPEESHSEKKSTDRKTAAAPSSTTAEPPPGEDASPNAFFVNNFWESDGPKILFDRLNASAELQTAYRSFLKERAATEKDYAKQLRKSLESTLLLKAIDKDGGLLGAAVTQQLNALDSLAAAHEALSNTLISNLEPRLKEHLQSSDERRKKQQAAAEASFKAKQTAHTALQGAAQKYRKEANSINSYSAQLTLVAPRELSRIQSNLDKCQRGIGKTAEEYKLAYKNYKHACSNFEYDYKMFCDLAQDLEEDKVQMLCDIGAQLTDMERRTWLNAAKAHEASAFTQVDVNDCISEFVESKATGPRIYNPPELIDQHSAASDTDTDVTFRVAAFPRSSFRYPTSSGSTVNKRASTASLVSSTPPQEASPQASPTRQRTASRLIPPSRQSASSAASSAASDRSNKQVFPTSSSSRSAASDVDASEALGSLRLGDRKTPEPAKRSSKQNMLAIGGKMYPVNSPTPSPERVLKPRHSNSADDTKSQHHGALLPQENQRARKEPSPAPVRRRNLTSAPSSSSHSNIPDDMPSEKMADDTFTEIEAWLSTNRSVSPAPAASAQPRPHHALPSSASEPAMHSSGLPVSKSRHAQRRIPLPTSPGGSQSPIAPKASSQDRPHRRSAAAAQEQDVFLSSPSTVVRPKSPGRSKSPAATHMRSHSEISLSDASARGSISYQRSPSPTPFEDLPRSTSPLPASSSMGTISSKTFNRPRQPTPPEAQPRQESQSAPVPHYSWSSPSTVSAAPSPSPWPASVPPHLAHHSAQMRQTSWSQAPSAYAESPVATYAPYNPSSSPAPFSAPTPGPHSSALYHHPGMVQQQHQQPTPPTPMPQILCLVRAEHAYTPTQDDELSLLPGEEVAIFKTDASGWWYGQSRTSHRTGLVPSNHVRML